MEEDENIDFINVLHRRLRKMHSLELEPITIKVGKGSKNYLKIEQEICMYIREDDSYPLCGKRLPLTKSNLMEMSEEDLLEIWTDLFL